MYGCICNCGLWVICIFMSVRSRMHTFIHLSIHQLSFVIRLSISSFERSSVGILECAHGCSVCVCVCINKSRRSISDDINWKVCHLFGIMCEDLVTSIPETVPPSISCPFYLHAGFLLHLWTTKSEPNQPSSSVCSLIKNNSTHALEFIL